MSYSRWSNSAWYTFWSARGDNPESKLRNEQYFEVCSIKCFTYKELITDIDGCLQQVSDEMASQCLKEEAQSKLPEDQREKNGLGTDAIYFGAWTATPAEMLELKEYMVEFINDIKEDKDLI